MAIVGMGKSHLIAIIHLAPESIVHSRSPNKL